jgi:protein dithiol:quinone oxidoreductase
MPRFSPSLPRLLFFAGFAACAALMAIALYFQHVMYLEPCPLCILQRVAVIALGAIFLVGALHDPGRIGRRVYAALALLTAGIGAAIAGRHVWLENLPEDRIPACGPGLDYMLENFPLMRALEMILRGSGECAEVAWTFLGISIPGWTLVAFVGFAGLSLYLFFRRFDRPAS